MADHAGFLQAICAHRDDDGHRLVYADWLEDNGDAARAAFIRLQCQLARMCQDADEPFVSALPADRLRPEHRRAFLAPLVQLGLPECVSRTHQGVPDGFAFYFRRGFVEDVEAYGAAAAKRFLRRAEELGRLTPLRNLRILPDSSAPAWDPAGGYAIRFDAVAVPLLQALLRLPVVGRLNTLDLRGHGLGTNALRPLLQLANQAPRPRVILEAYGFSVGNRHDLHEALGDKIHLVEGGAVYPDPSDDIPF